MEYFKENVPKNGELLHTRTNRYEEVLYDDGVEKILKYGIAFYKERCKVVMQNE